MRAGICSGFATGKIRTALLLTMVALALVIPCGDVAFGQTVDKFTTLQSQNIHESVNISSVDSVELLLTDPQGRRTGFDPGSQTRVQDIPTASYASVGNSTEGPFFKTIELGYPLEGEYTLDVIGTRNEYVDVYVSIDAYVSATARLIDITHTYSVTTAPGRVSRFTFPVVLSLFTAFNPMLRFNLASHTFVVNGTFTLGERGTISLMTQPVTIGLSYPGGAFFHVTVPAGSFTQTPQGTFVFTGIIHGGLIRGIQITAELTPTGGQNYTFQISGMGAADQWGPPSANPVTVTLGIGNNGGNSDVTAESTR